MMCYDVYGMMNLVSERMNLAFEIMLKLIHMTLVNKSKWRYYYLYHNIIRSSLRFLPSWIWREKEHEEMQLRRARSEMERLFHLVSSLVHCPMARQWIRQITNLLDRLVLLPSSSGMPPIIYWAIVLLRFFEECGFSRFLAVRWQVLVHEFFTFLWRLGSAIVESRQGNEHRKPQAIREKREQTPPIPIIHILWSQAVAERRFSSVLLHYL